MRHSHTPWEYALIVLVAWTTFAPVSAAEPATAGTSAVATGAMAATVHPLATEAALAALRRGGNAVDAAVAAGLTLGVVDGHNSGIGGGCFILIRMPDGTFTAIDGRETAPAAARRDMFLRAGKPDGSLSQTGPLAVATPGALAAYELALAQHGRFALAELLVPAANLADEGFEVDRSYASSLEAAAAELRRFPGSAAMLLKPDGSPYKEGETLRLADLAKTYRSIAEQGTDWFYRGEFAERVGRWMRENEGLLRQSDFAAYTPLVRQPIATSYRDYTIIGFPPPSSGGIHVAQILQMLERFDLAELQAEDPASLIHVVAESMKLAFADRAYWLGDADFTNVPRGLIDPEYTTRLSRRIDPSHVVAVEQYGKPPTDMGGFGKHTTHIAVADDAGYWVAITQTVNTTFGSKVVVPGTGVVLNNEMDDFSIAPGVPNAFGLIGAEANAVEPGKRPLSSMSPTIVLRGDEPILTVGAAGGPRIITQVALVIIRHLDLGMPLEEAVAAPRFHHQWRPDRLYLEDGIPADVQSRLRALGHTVELTSRAGVTQAIGRAGEPDDRLFTGVADPRVPGKAAGLQHD